MIIGKYEINPQVIILSLRMLKNSLITHLAGVPSVSKSTPYEISVETIKGNTNGIVRAGSKQFRYGWTVDTGKAFRGLKKVLSGEQLSSLCERILNTSSGYVPTCFSNNSAFNIPYKRVDNLPWLFFMIDELDNDLLEEKSEVLQKLYEHWMREYWSPEKSMIKTEATHDWIDTCLRPSSTYSNLCVLKMFEIIDRKLGIKTHTNRLKEALLVKRWAEDHFIDFEGSGDYLVGDANALALYFELFDRSLRETIASTLERSGLMEPFPMKLREGSYDDGMMLFFTRFSPTYHTTSIWPHIGLMALNGFKKLNIPYKEYKERIDQVVMKYGFLEVFDEKGKPYSTPFHVAEHDLTMFAGQYLELSND